MWQHVEAALNAFQKLLESSIRRDLRDDDVGHWRYLIDQAKRELEEKSKYDECAGAGRIS